MSAPPPAEGAPGAVGGPGRVDVEGEHASITLRRLLRHPIEEVWAAITDPKEVAQWSLARVAREAATGRLEMWHVNDLHAVGRVLAWEPPRVYEYEWKADPAPALPAGEDSVVRYELSPVPEGTLLVLTHRKLTRRTAEVYARGLPSLLDRLAAQLEGAPLPWPPWLALPPDHEATR